MKMKMKYWTLKLPKQNNKYEVKLNHLKLELGLFGAQVGGNEMVAIDITAKPASSNPVSRLTLPFRRTSKRRFTHIADRRPLRKATSLLWDARDLRDFHVVVNDDSVGACPMAFQVLYGEGSEGKPRAKMTVIGKVSMNLPTAELLVRENMKTESNCQIQRKLPIELRVNGLSIEATLSVSVTFLKNNGKINEKSPYVSDESSIEFSTSSGCGNSINNAAVSNPTNKSEMFVSSETETRLDTVQGSWSKLSLNRSFKGLSFRTTSRKQLTLTPRSGPFSKSDEFSHLQDWQVKELTSRDGRAKLNTNVFFASFDQRSEQASGESACAALVTLIAHWLHSNQDMPTRLEFDNLITEGSSEWRRLCDSDAHLKLFPDKHFDLDTVIEANLRPLVVVSEKSYTGFFSPDKFECLKGAMSFDEIWDQINRNVVDYEPRIYIVSWNDHFFVLKVEADAYYIVDSLGERLFEGCKKAFILKFDDSSLMYEKVDKASGGVKSEEKRVELVCSGKECCKEFVKRFLSALPLKQLEEQEKKGSISNPYLHRLLQIEFHYSSSLSPSPASSSTSSLFSSGALEVEL